MELAQRGNTDERRSRAEAAVWMVRLYGDGRTPEFERALREWLAAHPQNARHFDEITQVWDLGGQITGRGLPRMRASPATRPGIRWIWAVAASLALAAIAGGLGYRAWDETHFATGRGEQRLVRLQDGSRVTLNSSTRLQVILSRSLRHVRLERGEALFEVAQDAARPFIVSAGSHEITALGTSFVVRYEADRTAVTLVEGKVQVSDDEGFLSDTTRVPRHEAAVLRPGERMTFTTQTPPRLDAPRIEAVTAWRRGEVLLDYTPLSDAVVEMNRYDTRQLVIDDPALASLSVSGVYRGGDSIGFARGVADLHGLTIREEGSRIHLSR